MDDDDRLIGQILTRREALGVLGSTSAAALLAGCAPEVLDEALATASPSKRGPG